MNEPTTEMWDAEDEALRNRFKAEQSKLEAEFDAAFNLSKADLRDQETKRILTLLIIKVGSEQALADAIAKTGMSFDEFIQYVIEHETEVFATPA